MTTHTPKPLRLRFILNTFYSGPQAWFFLADDRGYFRDEGLEVEFHEGDTLANAVPRLADGLFDAGYGDMNALIECAATRPADAPVAVYVMHNRSPYTIAVDAAGPIRHPRDLAGKRLVSHPNDAAWRLLPELCAACGVDASTLDIEFSDLPHRELVPLLLAGRWDGMFGFVNTLNAQALEAGVDPASALRHLPWHVFLPSLYGAALMVTQTLRLEHPQQVAGLVRAVQRGVADTVADIGAAIDAVARRNPAIDRAANRARLEGTLTLEMAHPEGATLGLGAVDAQRLATCIEVIARAKSMAPAPDAQRVFDPSFLPEPDTRIRSLAEHPA
jgi:NitT/TauT family transport system substrate-binding protein